MSLLTGARRARVAAVCLLPLLPAVVTPGLVYPYVTGRALAFRVLVETAVLASLAIAASERAPAPRPATDTTWIPVAGGLYVAGMCLSTALGAAPDTGLWSTFERMDGLVQLGHLIALYAVLRVAVPRSAWPAVAAASVAVCALVAVHAVAAGGRPTGALGNPAFLGSYLVIHAGVAAWLAATSRDAPRTLAILAATWLLVALALTGARGPVLAAVAGTLAAGATLGARHGTRRAVATAVAIATVAGLAAAALYAARHAPALQDNHLFSGRLLQDPRLSLWRVAGRAIAERPVLGWGLEGFPVALGRHYDPTLGGPARWADRAHCGPLDAWIAGGILGVTGYVGLHVAAVRRAWGLDPVDRAAAVGLVVAMATRDLFAFPALPDQVAAVALLAYLGGPLPTPRLAPARALLPAVVVGTAAWATVLQPARAARALEAAAAPDIAIEERLARIDAALTLHPMAAVDATRLLTDLAPPVARSPQVPEATKSRFVSRARALADAGTVRHPTDPRAWHTAGALAYRLGATDDAIARLTVAVTLAPRVPILRVARAQALLAGGDARAALREARGAFALNPRVDEARVVLALAAVHAGALDVAVAVLDERATVRPGILLDPRLAAAFAAVDHPDTLAALWRRHADRPVFRDGLVRLLREGEPPAPAGRFR